MMQLLKQRAEKLVKRRQEDVKDQSLEYMAGNDDHRVLGYKCLVLLCLVCNDLIYTSCRKN